MAHRTINIRDNDDAQLWKLAMAKAQRLRLSLTWVILRLLAMWIEDEVKVEAE